MLRRAHEENVQRGPTSSVLNVSRSRSERAAAKVPISRGSLGSGSCDSSFGFGSRGSDIPATISRPGARRKRGAPWRSRMIALDHHPRMSAILALLTLGACAPRPDADTAGQASSETRLAVDVPYSTTTPRS